MDSQTQLIFKKMLDPKFNWAAVSDYEVLVSLAQEAVALKDLPQRIIGKIVLQIDTSEHGALAKFSKEIGVSTDSLQIYMWVERRLEGLIIPADIPWSALRVIAGSDDPAKWVKRIVDEGLSFAEVKRLVSIEKGIPEKHGHKVIKCTKCGFKTEGVKCGGCNTLL
jgi:hypothetical protein